MKCNGVILDAAKVSHQVSDDTSGRATGQDSIISNKLHHGPDCTHRGVPGRDTPAACVKLVVALESGNGGNTDGLHGCFSRNWKVM